MGNAEDETAVHAPGGDGKDGLPERQITVNMVVGYNMGYFRRVAGLTQEQLGEPLGWTKVAVSAAERSWDGKRVRQFDADLIADLAGILQVPIAALFLPPDDDGVKYRYVFRGAGREGADAMRWLLTHALPEPSEDDTQTMRAYEGRLVVAMNKYLDPGTAAVVATRLKERATEEQLAAALRDARGSRETLDGFYDWIDELIRDNNLLQDLLTAMLKATPEGQALLEDQERKERGELTPEDLRRAWDNLAPEHREWQRHVARIARELFGERGPVNRGEINQVIAEARKRGLEGPNAAAVLLRHDGTYRLVQPYDTDQQEAEGS